MIHIFFIINNTLLLPIIIEELIMHTPTHNKYQSTYKEEESFVTNTHYKSSFLNKSTERADKSSFKSLAVSKLEDARKTIDSVIVNL